MDHGSAHDWSSQLRSHNIIIKYDDYTFLVCGIFFIIITNLCPTPYACDAATYLGTAPAAFIISAITMINNIMYLKPNNHVITPCTLRLKTFELIKPCAISHINYYEWMRFSEKQIHNNIELMRLYVHCTRHYNIILYRYSRS